MDCFSSFNIIGYSSPLLPCRPVDLRRGLIYSKNLQHTPSLVRVCASSPINPSRLSNQFHTGDTRYTPTLPR